MSVIWLTGLSGSGKTTIAENLVKHIEADIIDGDVVRKMFNHDLNHGKQDRKQNLYRVIELVHRKLSRTRNIVIAAFVSPDKELRKWTKVQFEQAGYIYYEVYVEASLETCQIRDVKGLYQCYHKGEDIKLAGLTEEYEKPDNPHVICNTDEASVDECIKKILDIVQP